MNKTTAHMLASVFLGALLLGAGCKYDPPPEVRLSGPENNHYLVGEAITLQFSEPVKADTLEIRIWPGEKDRYNVEGEVLGGTKPLMQVCRLDPGSLSKECRTGVTLTLEKARTAATLTVTAESGLPLNWPLVLEVTGSLTDDEDRKKKVSWFFDFQIVEERWDPYADAGDATNVDAAETTPEPFQVQEGPHLFHSIMGVPDLDLHLPQQFFCDVQVNEETGVFVVLLTDADPIGEAPRNTKVPVELFADISTEGFIFTVRGQFARDGSGAVTFDTEPATLDQTISGIHFVLRDMLMHGQVSANTESGLSSWDGTLAVKEVELSGDAFEGGQSNFQIFQLQPDEVPDGMRTVCDPDPCKGVEGKCELLEGVAWPPAGLCPTE